MKHKLTKYKADGKNEKEWVNVFVLTSNFQKFKKGEIFEEFYTAGNRYYAVSSNLFTDKHKNGHTKIIPGNLTKIAPVSFFKKIRKQDSILYRLHNTGFEGLSPVEYQVN